MTTKDDCTCPDPDADVFDVDCPAHIVIACPPVDERLLEAQRRYDAGDVIEAMRLVFEATGGQ